MSHVKKFKGQFRRFALGETVPKWYKYFPPDHLDRQKWTTQPCWVIKPATHNLVNRIRSWSIRSSRQDFSYLYETISEIVSWNLSYQKLKRNDWLSRADWSRGVLSSWKIKRQSSEGSVHRGQSPRSRSIQSQLTWLSDFDAHQNKKPIQQSKQNNMYRVLHVYSPCHYKSLQHVQSPCHYSMYRVLIQQSKQNNMYRVLVTTTSSHATTHRDKPKKRRLTHQRISLLNFQKRKYHNGVPYLKGGFGPQQSVWGPTWLNQGFAPNKRKTAKTRAFVRVTESPTCRNAGCTVVNSV